MVPGIRPAAVDLGLPEEFPGVPVETKDGLSLGIGGGQEDTISHERWRTVPTPRQGRFPQHAFCFAPVQRWILAGRGNAVVRWAPPARPIGAGIPCGESPCRLKQEDGRAQEQRVSPKPLPKKACRENTFVLVHEASLREPDLRVEPDVVTGS